jgi:hypothetical protein|tara:strand:- start:67 stop:513 length:447 start_codon:yes stop_codon:yes gene_type:complete
MSKIVYTNSDGTIAIIHPIGSIANGLKAIPAGISTYTVVEDSIIPSDRTFRSSWVQVGIGTTATVSEDMTKAREIHKTNIRTAREPLLTALDVEFQKAQETSAGITTIVAKKQALRDAPAASGISTAANATELKAQWDTSILGSTPYA